MKISVLMDMILEQVSCEISGAAEDTDVKRFTFLMKRSDDTEPADQSDESCLYIGACELASDLPKRAILLTSDEEIPPSISQAHTVIRVNPADYVACLNIVTKAFFSEKEREEAFSRLLSGPIDLIPFHEIIDNAAMFLDRSLILTDLSFHVVAYSTSRVITDPIWKTNVKRGFCSYEFIEAMNVLIPDHTLPNTSEPFFVNCDASRENKICSILFYNQRPIGYLVLLDNEKGILPYHLQYLSRISQILILSLKHEPNFRSMFINASENMFLNLLEGKEIDPAQAEMFHATVKKAKALRCMMFIPKNHSRHDLFYMQRNLYSLFPKGSVFLYRDCVIAVVSDEDAAMILKPAFWTRTGEHRGEHIAEEIKLNNVKEVGISSAFRSLTDFPDYLNYAWMACDIANKLGHRDMVHLYDRYQFFHILSTCQDEKLLRAYIHPAFDVLREYDLINDSALLMTLQTYIEKGMNAKDTATELYLHRNTLTYRLNKIRELTNVDFKNLETMFQLSCSFRINQLLQIY